MKNEFNKDRASLIRTFENPGREYRGKPFWSWNGELEKDELIRQAKVMKEMGLGGFFMHARSGLITEYLGDEWFDLTNAVADAAEGIDMEAWLYDEDRWPSGSAGGKAAVGGTLDVKGDLTVESLARAATANANVGANTLDSTDLKVSLASADVSKAIANENLTNTAALVGAAYGTEKRDALVDMGDYAVVTTTETDYDVVKDYTITVDNLMYAYNPMKKFTTSQSDEEIKIAIAKYFLTGRADTVSTTIPAYAAFKGVTMDKYNNLSNRQRYSKSAIQNLQRYLKRWLEQNNTTIEEASDDTLKVWYTTLTAEYRMNAASNKAYAVYLDTFPEYARTTDQAEFMRRLYDYTEEDFENFGYLYAANYSNKVYGNLLSYTATPNYGTKTVEKTEWVPEYQPVKVEVPLYDATKNTLWAHEALTVNAGMENGAQSKAEARTDGAMGIGAVSMGSLEAEATASDAVSALLEGMTVQLYDAVNLTAASDTVANAVGFRSGGEGILQVDHSTVKAMVGTPQNKQSVNVIVGDNVHLNSRNFTGNSRSNVNISANNQGYAEASMNDAKTTWGLGNFKTSTQETESWYNTLVSIGEDVGIRGASVSILSQDSAGAKSKVESNNVGILMNFNTMQGKNTIHQENNIDVGKFSTLQAMRGNLLVEALQNTQAHAETVSGGGGLIAGDTATARNTIDRVARVNMGAGSAMESAGFITLRAKSGEGDDIYTRAYVDSKGLVDVANAKAYADVTSSTSALLVTSA